MAQGTKPTFDQEIELTVRNIASSRATLIIGPLLVFGCYVVSGQTLIGLGLTAVVLALSTLLTATGGRLNAAPKGSASRRSLVTIYVTTAVLANVAFSAAVAGVALASPVQEPFAATMILACATFQMLVRYRASPLLGALNAVPYLAAAIFLGFVAWDHAKDLTTLIALALVPVASFGVMRSQLQALRAGRAEIAVLQQSTEDLMAQRDSWDVALRAADGGYGEYDVTTGRYVRFAGNVFEVTGLTEEEFQKNPLAYMSRITPEQRRQQRTEVDKLPLDGVTSYEMDHDFSHPDGGLRYFRCSTVRFMHPDGPRQISMIFDRTKQKQAELALEAARMEAIAERERWELAAGAAGAAVYEYDLENRRYFPSERYEELIGESIDRLNNELGGSMRHLIPQPWRDEVAEALGKMISEGSSCTVDYPVDRPDGQRIWLRCHTATKMDAETGKMRVFSFNLDITDVREAEQAAAILANQRQREWEQLYENSAIAQNVWDGSAFHARLCHYREERVPSLTQAMLEEGRKRKRKTGRTPTGMVNAASRALFGIDDAADLDFEKHFPPQHLLDVYAALDDWQPGQPIGPLRTIVSRSNGEVRDVMLEIRPVGNPLDPWHQCITAFIDITDQVRAEAALAAAKVEAENANRAKSEFLAAMSHEIRTPMNAILGMGELLVHEELSEQARDHVETMRSSGQLLLTVLNDLLDLSKIEAGKMDIERVPVCVKSLLGQVERLWSARAEEKGLSFSIEVAPDAPTGLMGDPSRLQQIIFNLVSNAVKFTNRGGITIGVNSQPAYWSGEQSASSENLVLSVKDTGEGISDEAMARLFNPFTQADASTSRRFGGTGLGLAICKRLAEAMGGSVKAHSKLGQGSTFTVVLPLERASVPTAVHESTDDADAESSVSMRVLLVEDNPVNQKIASAFLNLFGVQFVMANDGLEAVEIAKVEAFDAILMDVQMPVMDGLQATAAIRAGAGPNAAVPIIGLTADAFDEQKRKGFAAGMTDYLTKPIDPRALMAALSKAASMGSPVTGGVNDADAKVAKSA